MRDRLPDPLPDPDAVAAVRAHCAAAGYTVDGLTGRLGEAASRALLRDELLPARRALAGDDSPLGRLARLFLLGERVTPGDDLAAYDAIGVTRAGHAVLDLRPVDDVLVVSDLGSEVTGVPVAPDHVLGVGGASVTLAEALPRGAVGRALDLGTGCGIQAVTLAAHAREVVATDSSPRALRLAALTLALNGVSADLREGDLLDPVVGERFDLVASNPPFVVGPAGRQSFTYRDSGREGDGVTAELLRGLPALLSPGGTAVVLGNWAHRRGEDWRERVGGWLAGSGCDAWVAQREVSDPAEYVALWLRDTGTALAGADAAATAWLDWFDAQDVEGVGFGVVSLRRVDAADPTLALEDVREPGAAVRGPEVAGRLDRTAWLRANDEAAMLSARLHAAPELALQQAASVGAEGWEVGAQVLQLAGRSAPTDAVGVSLVAGCDGTRPLGDLLDLLAAAYSFPARAGLPAVRHLVERGVLLPP